MTMKIILHSFSKLFLFLIAGALLAASVPPAFALAQDGDEATLSEAVTLEEFYRESEIEFLGKDLSSCSNSSSGGPANISVGKDFSLGSEGKERRVNLMKALVRDFGLSPAQAAGIIGNFMQESGGEHLPPNVNQGGHAGPPRFSGGYGWAQWTGSRQTAFINYATTNGYMASRSVDATDAANYAWLTNELTTGYTSTITELKKQSSATSAAVSFHKTFERSADSASQIGERGTSAEKALKEFNEGGVPGGGGPTSGSGGCSSSGNVALVGDKAFPLATSKSEMNAKNPNLFKNNTVGQGGHPYTAFDILANPDTEVVAFMSGEVTTITEDRCPGRMISIYNKESDITISYLHLNMNQSTHIGDGATVKAGDHVGVVGPAGAGCGTPHLHIDAAKGNKRPGCSRNECSAANASRYFDIGPDLFITYDALQN